MRLITNPAPSHWPALIQRPASDTAALAERVQEILDQVKLRGDEALRTYSRLFDQWDATDLQVPDADFREAERSLPQSLTDAILIATENIRRFHSARISPDVCVETFPGVTCWTKQVPLQRVGVYIPGGSAPLFSTVLMLGIPAALAGCPEVILCTPPSSKGQVHPAILFASRICGISKIFRVGGAQAIAAMAYGTASIPAVDKIVGPGNRYVTRAKEVVSGQGIAIDFPAGPSELLVVADASANPAFVAADLISQAEHGPDSQVILVALQEGIAEKVAVEINKQLQNLPRREVAAQALAGGHMITFGDEQKAMGFVNAYAPEHLILNTRNPESLAAQVIHAGSVFLGAYSPESAGDYASGTNHTLPTAGYSRLYGGVSCASFVKEITFQKLTREGLSQLGPYIEEMAAAENLMGHRQAVTIRLQSK